MLKGERACDLLSIHSAANPLDPLQSELKSLNTIWHIQFFLLFTSCFTLGILFNLCHLSFFTFGLYTTHLIDL